MQYNLKGGAGIDMTAELRSYLETRLAHHVDGFLARDTAAHANVEFEHAPLRDGEKYRAELTVSTSGAVYRAEAWGETLHSAIDVAVDGLSRELRRAKRKRVHVLRHGASRIKDFLRGWRTRP